MIWISIIVADTFDPLTNNFLVESQQLFSFSNIVESFFFNKKNAANRYIDRGILKAIEPIKDVPSGEYIASIL